MQHAVATAVAAALADFKNPHATTTAAVYSSSAHSTCTTSNQGKTHVSNTSTERYKCYMYSTQW